MKKSTKVALLCFFIPCEVLFAVCTLPALFIFLPVGIIGVVVTTFFGLVIASIFQSLHGKKPVFNLFREGNKTCKKCGFTYEKAKAYSCPRCAEEKRRNQPPLPTFQEMQEARLRRKMRIEKFWDVIGTFTVLDELQQTTEKPPLGKKTAPYNNRRWQSMDNSLCNCRRFEFCRL